MPNGDMNKDLMPEVSPAPIPDFTLDDIIGEDDPNHPESIEAAKEESKRSLPISGSDRLAKFNALTKNRSAYTPEELSSIQSFIQPKKQEQAIPYRPGMGTETEDVNAIVQTREAGQSPIEKEAQVSRAPAVQAQPELPATQELPDLPAIPQEPVAAPQVAPAPPSIQTQPSKLSGLSALMAQFQGAKSKNAEAIKKAEDRKTQLDVLGAIANLGQGIGLAGTGIAPSKVDLSKDMREEILRLKKEGKSGSQIDDYLKIMKLQKLQDEVDPDKNDPNSEISKQAQNQELAQLKALKIDHDPEEIRKMSFNALNSKKATAYARKASSKFAIAKEGRLSSKFDLDVDKEDWKRIEKREDDLIKRINEFNNYPVVKDNMTALAMANTANEVLARKNPMGDKSLVNFLARASQEKGALTENDKKPFGGSMALGSRARQIIEDYKSGRFTEENRRFVRDLIDVYKKAAARNIQNEAIRRANQFGGINFPKKVLYNKYMGLATGGGENFNEDSKNLRGYILNKDEVQKQLGYGKSLTETKPVQMVSEEGKSVVKKQYSPSANKTRLIYSDGSEEILDGRQ